MANYLTMADITRIRTLAQAGWSQRRIAEELGHDRGTISKYLREVEPPPDEDGSKPAISTAGNSAGRTSVAAPHRERIEPMLEKGMSAEAIWRELRDEHGFEHSYESVKRFVRKLKARAPKRVWRLECNPGEEAQVDFGVVRCLRREDGKLGYAHVLRVTLSFSRKGYTEALPHQNSECFIRALENAFRHFGGVPATLRPDNLKAAVHKADWHDPELNPKIEAFAAHYGTVIIPTRPYTPQHKGKVESDIGYVKRSALKGKEFGSLRELNETLRAWETGVADCRIHGTTRKQVQGHFQAHEKEALRPLPPELFPCYQEGLRVVHRDSYVEVQRAYYQVPPEYVGRRLWVRWDSKMLHILSEEMCPILSHVRLERGGFSHCLGARGLRKDAVHHTSLYWIDRAALLGSCAEKWAVAAARNRPDHCIRVLQGLLSLHDPGKHRAADIDKACEVALAGGDYTLKAIKQTLALLARPGAAPPSMQEQLFLGEEHPLIRPLSHYQDLLGPEEIFSHNPTHQTETTAS
jgi:transposase